MTPFGRWRATQGTTLLEMLMYVVILGVVLNISAQTLLSCMRLSSYGTVMADRVTQVGEVERAFRQTAGAGCALADKVGPFAAGPGVAIVELPADSPDGRRYAVFGALRSPNEISKAIVIQDKDGVRLEGMTTYPLDVRSLSFSANATGRLLTMNVGTRSSHKQPNTEDEHMFSVALRGAQEPQPGQHAETTP